MLLDLIINILLLSLKSNNNINYSQNYSSDILEDSNLITPQLIEKYGYPAEVHEIETEDGYRLQMHRIKNTHRKPILLMHGLGDSSATFVMLGPNIGLGYYLWEMGYDVWLGNARGNRYSQKHKYLNEDDPEFWKFSWHEIGIYDLPAMIDYVLTYTNYKKIFYIGHSQGTTVFFVMASKRPEYNSKIDLMQALAPVAYVAHVQTPLFFYVDTLLRIVPEDLVQRFSSNHGMYKNLCTSSVVVETVCMKVLESAVGKDYDEINKTMFPIILGHVPAGTGVRQLKHFIQNVYSRRFQEYNYGLKENLLRYGKLDPPEYNLSLIETPTIFHYTLNDNLAHPVDVNRTYFELGNPKGKFLVPNPKWNHVDFIWSRNTRHLFYGKLLKFIKEYESNSGYNMLD